MHPLYAKLVIYILIFKLKMKKGIHPENYRPVVFKDMFYTGKSKLVDTAGRVDKFMSRYGKAAKK